MTYKIIANNDTLSGHTHLLNEKNVKFFRDRIIKEVTKKTSYKEEVAGDNSHSKFLSQCFKTSFKAFLRPGYHIDALLDLRVSSNEIQKRLSGAGIQTYNISLDEQNYLVIPNVNTKEIADRIRTIPPL
jgi:hypothetical protein